MPQSTQPDFNQYAVEQSTNDDVMHDELTSPTTTSLSMASHDGATDVTDDNVADACVTERR